MALFVEGDEFGKPLCDSVNSTPCEMKASSHKSAPLIGSSQYAVQKISVLAEVFVKLSNIKTY